MAKIIGTLRPDATYGEEAVLGLLRNLPDDYIVWPELKVDEHHPDFVILHPRLGVAVLEVKDWHEVIQASHDTVTILRRDGSTHSATNPERATRDKMIATMDKLRGDVRLIHREGDYAGKLRLPVTFGVVFANMGRHMAGILTSVVSDSCAIYRDSLKPGLFEERLRELDWIFPVELSAADVDLVRGVLYPELQVAYRGTDGRIIQGVVDLKQEQVAREGLLDMLAPREEAETSEHGVKLARSMAVRLVRGPAGTGKTVVLTLRAKYLAKLNPTWRILVLTFNNGLAGQLNNAFANYRQNITATTFHGICEHILNGANRWHSGPSQGQNNLLRAAMPAGRDSYRLGFDLISQEIKWMKDVGVREREQYLAMARTGRGRALRREDREKVYAVYEAYQKKLLERRQFDWDDVAGLTVLALDDGAAAMHQYDAILVDEAHDFAPVWFDVLRRLLRPQTGTLFLAADGTQRIYRNYSWREMGLDVVGRSRVLRVPYRNTYEITQAAQQLLADRPSLREALRLEEDDYIAAEVDERQMRRGPRPTIASFNKESALYTWLGNQIDALLHEGFQPNEIAILALSNEAIRATTEGLRAKGLPVGTLKESQRPDQAIAAGTIHSAKGMEFRAVFVIRLDELFKHRGQRQPPEDQRRLEADHLRLLYVAMTRGRDRLALQYNYPLPDQLKPLEKYLKKQD